MKEFNIDNMTGRNHSGAQSNKPLKRLSVSSLVGDNIFNLQGEALGQIMDMMINIPEGTIEYVVLKFGGSLGMNQKYFAVPFQALSIDEGHHHAFILNETRDSLKGYPGFDKNHWPETNSHKTHARYSNYGGFMGANTGAEY